MDKKLVLKSSLGLASVVLMAGGGKLIEIAPPGDFEVIFAGIASLFALAALSLCIAGMLESIKGISAKQSYLHMLWALVAFIATFTFVTTTLDYYRDYQKWVVEYKDGNSVIARFTIGDELTLIAQEVVKNQVGASPSDLIGGMGGGSIHTIEKIWTRASIADAKYRLMKSYVILIVALGFMLFAAVELQTFKNTTTSD